MLCSDIICHFIDYLAVQGFVFDGIGLVFSLFCQWLFAWDLHLLDLCGFVDSPEVPVLVHRALHLDIVDGLDVDPA